MLHFCLKLCKGENKMDTQKLAHSFPICKAELGAECLVHSSILRDHGKKQACGEELSWGLNNWLIVCHLPL